MTVVIKTAKAASRCVPNNLATIGILSAKANGGENVKFRAGGCTGLGTPPKSVDFNDPAKAVGTGPYRLKEYTRGTQHRARAQRAATGATSRTGRRSPSGRSSAAGPRVAALLAGDVDMIENPPIQDFEQHQGGRAHRSCRACRTASSTSTSTSSRTRPGRRRASRARTARIPSSTSACARRCRRRSTARRSSTASWAARRSGRRVAARSAVRRRRRTSQGREVRSRRREEAAGRGRLPERLRAHARLAQRPLHQRREDRAGGRADADPHRHQDQRRRDDRLDLLHAAQQVRVLAVSRRLGRRHRRDVELDRTRSSSTLDAATRGFGPTNRGRYSNKTVDELIIKALATIDDSSARALLQQASEGRA